MNNFFTRTFTGIIFVVLIVSSVILSRYFFAVVFLAITILSLDEFYTLVKSKSRIPAGFLGIVIGSLMFLSFFLASAELIEFKYLYLNIPLILLIFVLELFRNNNTNIANISSTLTGILYIALPLAVLNFFYNYRFITGENKYSVLLGFFALVWLHDVGAYLVGSVIGKHKLFERISPKKTWEGSVGAAVICVVAASFLPGITGVLNTINWIIIAAIIIVSGTFGDLTESMMKRNLNRKDSGKLLPGHGGILDRFDAVFFASPMVFVYLMLIN